MPSASAASTSTALAARSSAAALDEQVGGGEQGGVLLGGRRATPARRAAAFARRPSSARTAAGSDMRAASVLAGSLRAVSRRKHAGTGHARATRGRRPSGGVRPCRCRSRAARGRSGRGDPASPSSRSSPTVEALVEDSPPAGRRRVVRQECDGSRDPQRKSGRSGNAGRGAISAPDAAQVRPSEQGQGRTTRSSRWTTSWGSPSASSDVWRPATAAQRRRRSS